MERLFYKPVVETVRAIGLASLAVLGATKPVDSLSTLLLTQPMSLESASSDIHSAQRAIQSNTSCNFLQEAIINNVDLYKSFTMFNQFVSPSTLAGLDDPNVALQYVLRAQEAVLLSNAQDISESDFTDVINLLQEDDIGRVPQSYCPGHTTLSWWYDSEKRDLQSISDKLQNAITDADKKLVANKTTQSYPVFNSVLSVTHNGSSVDNPARNVVFVGAGY